MDLEGDDNHGHNQGPAHVPHDIKAEGHRIRGLEIEDHMNGPNEDEDDVGEDAQGDANQHDGNPLQHAVFRLGRKGFADEENDLDSEDKERQIADHGHDDKQGDERRGESKGNRDFGVTDAVDDGNNHREDGHKYDEVAKCGGDLLGDGIEAGEGDEGPAVKDKAATQKQGTVG